MPHGETPDAGLMRGKIPMDLDEGAAVGLAPSRILHRNLQWFRIQVASPLLKRANSLCR